MAEKVDVGLSISKFDGKNYPQWRFQMVCALKAKGVFDITCGIEKQPTATETSAAARAKWSKDDAIRHVYTYSGNGNFANNLGREL